MYPESKMFAPLAHTDVRVHPDGTDQRPHFHDEDMIPVYDESRFPVTESPLEKAEQRIVELLAELGQARTENQRYRIALYAMGVKGDALRYIKEGTVR